MRYMLPLLFVMICLISAFAEEPATVIEPLSVEDLGVPVRTMRRRGNFLVAKPDNAGWWFITSYNPMRRSSFRNQIFVIDLNAGAYEVVWGPIGGTLLDSFQNRGIEAPDGRFYISQYGQVGLWAFDRTEGSMEYYAFEEVTDRVTLGVSRLGPKREKLFMGTSSGRAYLISFDINTREWRNYGVPDGDQPAPRYVWSMAVGNQYVYSGMGKNPWHLIATHIETGEHTELLQDIEMEYLLVRGRGENCHAVVTLAAEGDEPVEREIYHLKDGKAVRVAEPPEQEPVHAADPEQKPELVTSLARPTSEGKAQLWYRLPGKEWTHVDLENIQTMEWKFVYLLTMDDGRLIGAPQAYEDIFIYNPNDDKTEILGKATMSMGKMVTVGGKVYMCGYPGTIIHEYDPETPWTYDKSTPTQKEPPLTSPDSNPRFCSRLGEIGKTHHVRGAAVGADGFVYVGGHAERQHVGGGLMWWDPVNRKAGGIREPFELHDCDDIGVARNGELIVYSSRPVADPRKEKPTPDTGKLFLLDVFKKEIIGKIAPVPGASRCGPVAGVGDLVYGVAQQGDKHIFYVVNLVDGKTVHSAQVSSRVAEMKIGPDGNIYAFIGGVLTRIDPKTFELIPLGSVDNAERMTFRGNDLYLTGRNLRRINNVPELKAIQQTE